MKKIAFFILLFYAASSVKGQEISEAVCLNAMHSISSHDLLEYVRIQCDDKYQGRLTGTKEYQECAEWLASCFSEWGIAPAGDNGNWFQW
jgi:hypothetical protein